MATSASPHSRLFYIQSLEAKLIQKKAQLAYIKRKVERAVEAGRIETSEQLHNAEKRADGALTTVNEKLQQLKDANDDTWEELKFGVDIAWDDLSLSIKNIVARFS